MKYEFSFLIYHDCLPYLACQDFLLSRYSVCLSYMVKLYRTHMIDIPLIDCCLSFNLLSFQIMKRKCKQLWSRILEI